MKNWFKFIKISNQKNESLKLTELELNIFAIIKAARTKYAPGVELRVAGGWVRDRILGKVSDDIDIAVTGGDGNIIAEAVRKFDLEMTNGERTENPYSVSLEKTLPGEKSKSSGLKVGAIKILGIKIEFVPMRTEIYDSTSRIPRISSTNDPKEDVKRRDLTINAIYYNIDSGKIEDYCNGVDDLKNKVLKTPVDPIVTLKEDPLRTLRALRFLSKMDGFKLDENLKKAIYNKEVHDAYSVKVAPERAKAELEKMMMGQNIAEPTRYLMESGLYLPVFKSERLKNFKPITMDQNNPNHKFNLLDHTIEVINNLDKILKEKGVNEKDRMICLLSALFHDFGKMDPLIERPSKSKPGASSYPGHENVSAELAEEILTRLGFGDDGRIVSSIVEHHMRPHGDIESPKSIGNFIRSLEKSTSNEYFQKILPKLVYYLGMADTLSKGKVDQEEQNDIKHKNEILSKIEDFYSQREIVGKKPILNGMEISSLFPQKNPKTGFIKEMQNELIEAQDSGLISNKEEAKKLLLEKFK